MATKRVDAAFALALLALAMVVAGLFWAVLPAEYRANQSVDYRRGYEPAARSIAAGQGIPIDGVLEPRYPPAFPVMLAGLFRLSAATGVSEDALLLAFRLLCAGLSAVLLYALARLVWPPGPALLPPLAWLTYPFWLWVAKQPNSEVAFVPALFAALWLLWRPLLRDERGPRAWALYAGAGLLAGLTMLIRPAAIGLSAVMAVIVLLGAAPGTAWRARLGWAALVLAGTALAVLPWEATLYARTGRFIPLGIGGNVTMQDGLMFVASEDEYRRPMDVPADVVALSRAFYERRLEMQLGGMRGVVALALDLGRDDPDALLKLLGLKVVRVWYGNDTRAYETPSLLLQIVYLGLIGWGSLASWRRGRWQSAAGRMNAGHWLVALYFWGMAFLVVPLLRYMVPVMGLLLLALPGIGARGQGLGKKGEAERIAAAQHPTPNDELTTDH